MNHKKLQRIWREEGLRVPQSRRRKPLGTSTTATAPTADAPNKVWAVDFQFDATTDGRPLKIVSIVDEHTRECLGGLVERSITADTLIDQLDVLAAGTAPVDRIAGVVVAGREDDRYRPDAQRVHRALVEASVEAEYVELPGGHTFQVWTEGLRHALPFLSARGGLVPAAPDHLTPHSQSEEDPSR